MDGGIYHQYSTGRVTGLIQRARRRPNVAACLLAWRWMLATVVIFMFVLKCFTTIICCLHAWCIVITHRLPCVANYEHSSIILTWMKCSLWTYLLLETAHRHFVRLLPALVYSKEHGQPLPR
jgi:hypothetical protein